MEVPIVVRQDANRKEAAAATATSSVPCHLPHLLHTHALSHLAPSPLLLCELWQPMARNDGARSRRLPYSRTMVTRWSVSLGAGA